MAMSDKQFLLFFDECTQQPSSEFGMLPELRLAGNLTQLASALGNSSLIFLQAGGALRQEAIRHLLKEKKSFVMLGLEPADLNDTGRLQVAVRKKGIQVCWLGSLRFHQAAARIKELLSGGCLGEIQNCRYSKSPKNPWEPYKIQDLLNWLLPEKKSLITRLPSCETSDLAVDMEGTTGCAQILLHDNQAGTFRMKLHNSPEKVISCPNQAAETEIGLLLLLHNLDKPWKMLAAPWDCNR